MNLIKQNSHFLMRLLCLALILLALWMYQTKAQHWAEVKAANDAAIAEAEAYNAEILAAQEAQESEASEEPEEEAQTSSLFNDGTYTGTGMGFGGDIVVQVTIASDQVTDIQVTSHEGDDDSYYLMAESVIDEILTAQSTDVDTVSGATFSSLGIIDAVTDAISQAVIQ